MIALRRGLVLAALVAALLLPGVARVGARQARPVPLRLVHVVRAGETLWGIARQLDPGADATLIVGRLIAVNHLPGASIRSGQALFLPAR